MGFSSAPPQDPLNLLLDLGFPLDDATDLVVELTANPGACWNTSLYHNMLWTW